VIERRAEGGQEALDLLFRQHVAVPEQTLAAAQLLRQLVQRRVVKFGGQQRLILGPDSNGLTRTNPFARN